MNFKDYFKQHLINEMAMDPKYYDEREADFDKMIHLNRAQAYDIRDETKRMAEDPTKLYRKGQDPIDIGLTEDDLKFLHMANNNYSLPVPPDTLAKVKAIIDNFGHFVGRHSDVAADSATHPTFNTSQIPYDRRKKTFG